MWYFCASQISATLTKYPEQCWRFGILDSSSENPTNFKEHKAADRAFILEHLGEYMHFRHIVTQVNHFAGKRVSSYLAI